MKPNRILMSALCALIVSGCTTTNLAVADELYAPDFVCHFIAGSEWKGVEGLKAEVRRHRTSFPDWHEHIEQIVAEGDFVVTRFTGTGTQRGAFNGRPPTGKSVRISELAVHRIANGKIAEQWGCPDVLSLDQQLNAPDSRSASSSLIPPSLPSDGGEGRGEEACPYGFPLSSVLSPLVPREERKQSSMQPGPDSSAANKRIIRRYFDEWANRGDTAAADQLIATNVVLRNPPAVVSSLEDYKKGMASFHKAFPDLHFTIAEPIADGDKVAVHWTLRGTQAGEYQGQPATGKKISVTGISLFRLADGKIQEITVNMDRLGMMEQLGLLPGAPRPEK